MGETMEEISTHTSRVGCDEGSFRTTAYARISTHTSRVGCDSEVDKLPHYVAFLLTHPVWDVTGEKWNHYTN